MKNNTVLIDYEPSIDEMLFKRFYVFAYTPELDGFEENDIIDFYVKGASVKNHSVKIEKIYAMETVEELIEYIDDYFGIVNPSEFGYYSDTSKTQIINLLKDEIGENNIKKYGIICFYVIYDSTL